MCSVGEMRSCCATDPVPAREEITFEPCFPKQHLLVQTQIVVGVAAKIVRRRFGELVRAVRLRRENALMRMKGARVLAKLYFARIGTHGRLGNYKRMRLAKAFWLWTKQKGETRRQRFVRILRQWTKRRYWRSLVKRLLGSAGGTRGALKCGLTLLFAIIRRRHTLLKEQTMHSMTEFAENVVKGFQTNSATRLVDTIRTVVVRRVLTRMRLAGTIRPLVLSVVRLLSGRIGLHLRDVESYVKTNKGAKALVRALHPKCVKRMFQGWGQIRRFAELKGKRLAAVRRLERIYRRRLLLQWIVRLRREVKASRCWGRLCLAKLRSKRGSLIRDSVTEMRKAKWLARLLVVFKARTRTAKERMYSPEFLTPDRCFEGMRLRSKTTHNGKLLGATLLREHIAGLLRGHYSRMVRSAVYAKRYRCAE